MTEPPPSHRPHARVKTSLRALVSVLRVSRFPRHDAWRGPVIINSGRRNEVGLSDVRSWPDVDYHNILK